MLVEPAEGRLLLLSAAYFFFLLFGYYLIRPVREAMGIDRGWDNLPWLMTGTLIAMALVNPIFAMLVSRSPRRVFIPATYRFFAANLLVFYVLLMLVPKDSVAHVGYAFYIWVSVYNLFVVAVFWGFMADTFTLEQGKRLFPAIGIGGTLGGIAGPLAAEFLVHRIGQPPLLLLSAICLEAATQFMLAVARRGAATQPTAPREPSAGALEGLRLIATSRYLQLICLFMLMLTVLATLLYIEQGRIVEAAVPGRDQRTALFARIDLWANIVTLMTQALLTAWLIRWVGIVGALAVLPLVALAGFAALAATPMLAVVVAFQVVRRGLNYGVTRPTREVLFTVLGPDEKYKAKTFIDTFIYRVGDAAAGWVGLWLGPVAALVAIPLSLSWLAWALALGLMQRRKAAPAPQ